MERRVEERCSTKVIMKNIKPNVIIFGAGNYLEKYNNYIFEHFNVIAIIDNSLSKQNTDCFGFIVQSPQIINEIDYDLILVATTNIFFSGEIKKQLINMGVSLNKVRFTQGNGYERYKFDAMFFDNNLNYEEKRKLFSNNVERVMLEVNSACNRKCWFCPNSLVDNTSNVDMTDEVFNKIINELSEIDYSCDFELCFYNEPLMCSNIEERIKLIKEKLPNSYVYFFTNGDYLNIQKLAALEKAGLDALYVDIYLSNPKFDYDDACSNVTRMLNKLDLSAEIVKNELTSQVEVITCYGNMYLEIFARDFTLRTWNRAEAMPDNLPIPKIERLESCFLANASIFINYKGDVYPCCNFHHQIDKHQKYLIGNVQDVSIYDMFSGEKLRKFREDYLFHREILPCRSCLELCPTSYLISNFFRPYKKRPGTMI